MKKTIKVLKYSFLAIVTIIFLFFLVGIILVFSDDNEFHTKEIRHLGEAAAKIDKFYQENKRLPGNLQEVSIDDNFPYPPDELLNLKFKTAGDYKLKYHPIDGEDFTVVMFNDKGYIVYVASDQDVYPDPVTGRLFIPATFLWKSETYKSEEFLKNQKESPFNQPGAWPDI